MTKQSVRLCLDLFLTFTKIGLFTFGGGYAMLSLIEHNCVDKKQWITHDEMMEMTVIAESTPGPIAINCATGVGFRQAGFIGALFATVGVVLPSFLIIFLLSRWLDRFLEIPVVAHAFRGIKIAVALLILDAGITMARKMKRRPLPILLAALSCAVMLAVNFFSWNLSSLVLMLACGLIGLLAALLPSGHAPKGGDTA